jgi:hypothetical protein
MAIDTLKAEAIALIEAYQTEEDPAIRMTNLTDARQKLFDIRDELVTMTADNNHVLEDLALLISKEEITTTADDIIDDLS